MKILYLSAHAILEYDELKLLTELGHEVYSHGAYRDPRGAYTLPRPGIEGMKVDEEFIKTTGLHPRTDLPKELIEKFDTIIIMSGEREAALINNWDKIKHKRVILRTIGQSTPETEYSIKRMRQEGLEIIRYSPKEANLKNYAGHDAIIRFYKDPEEFKDWNGKNAVPINFTQTLRGRGRYVHYDEILGSLAGFPGAKVYGSGNNDLGAFNGGEVPYEELKRLLRDSAVFVYGGTWPASYTLSFIEAFMTGIPIVAISSKIANFDGMDFYEVEEILKLSGEHVCDNVEQMRIQIEQYLDPEYYRSSIKVQTRSSIATQLFGKENIKKQWDTFLKGGVK